MEQKRLNVFRLSKFLFIWEIIFVIIMFFSLFNSVCAKSMQPFNTRYSVVVIINLSNDSISYCFKKDNAFVDARSLNISFYDLNDCKIENCLICKIQKHSKIWYDEIELKKFYSLADKYIIKKSNDFLIESKNIFITHDHIRENNSYYIISPFENIYDLEIKVPKVPKLVLFWYILFILAFIFLMYSLLKS